MLVFIGCSAIATHHLCAGLEARLASMTEIVMNEVQNWLLPCKLDELHKSIGDRF